MTATADLFKQGMSKLEGGVTIVTASQEGVPAGLTATAVCSLSAHPPRLLACINRAGTTYGVITQCRHFCVNVLSADDRDLAARFAGVGAVPPPERFATGLWGSLKTGAPVLETALAAFDCRVASIIDTGSHAIIIGDVEDIRAGAGGEPLLYMDGRFSTLAPLAAAR